MTEFLAVIRNACDYGYSGMCTVTTIYYVPNLVGKYEKAFYNRTINFCTYLRQPLTDRVLNIVYENLNQRGNLPKRCPVLSASYTFNTSFDDMNLPGFLPESSFRFDLNFNRGPPTNELIFNNPIVRVTQSDKVAYIHLKQPVKKSYTKRDIIFIASYLEFIEWKKYMHYQFHAFCCGTLDFVNDPIPARCKRTHFGRSCKTDDIDCEV
uniref:Uncharacterized protein n=1 Tax=Anopheles culicifacies TaxID=139723 RepID=A0A182LWD1_9DIPT